MPGSQASTTDATAISLPSSQGSSQTICHPEKKVCLCRLPSATSSLPYKLSTRPTPTTTTSLPHKLSTPTSISSTPHRLSTPLPSPTPFSTPFLVSTTPAVARGLIPLKLTNRS